MAKLYSYCIRFDTGAAPNPFWGICTLVICKPKIRLAAEVGDWILATGSKRAPTGDSAGQLVCAMRVTKKLTMEDYDHLACQEYPNKVPDRGSRDRRRHVGDAHYDFSTRPPHVRQGVHNEHDREDDLGGKYALLSTDFYYFGRNAVRVPDALVPIVKQGPGNRAHANDPYVERAVAWIRSLPSGVQGDPQIWDVGEQGDGLGGCGGCGHQVRTDDDDDTDDDG